MHDFTMTMSGPNTVVVGGTWTGMGVVHAWAQTPGEALAALRSQGEAEANRILPDLIRQNDERRRSRNVHTGTGPWQADFTIDGTRLAAGPDLDGKPGWLAYGSLLCTGLRPPF